MSAKSRHNKRPVSNHNYLDKLMEIAKLGAFKPGQLTMIDIAHDDWCARLTGGVCGCSPEVSIKLQHNAGVQHRN